MEYEFEAELWLYAGQGAWVFVTLPKPMGQEIKELFGNDRSGFGSIKVTAETAGVSWKTSIFPDSKSQSYVLPIKAEIRKKAQIETGDKTKFKLSIH